MKIHCDLSRICEVEDSVVEWYDSQYFQQQSEILSFDHLKSNFKIISSECAGADGMVYKVHLEAIIPGEFNDTLLGLPITIKPQKGRESRYSAIAASHNEDGEVLVHEVKRVGFLIDRYVDMQLRVGDSLVVYLQKAHKAGREL